MMEKASKSDDDVMLGNPPCRTCIKNNGTRPIWGDAYSPDISFQLITVAGVDVQLNDELPQCICEECFIYLETANLFIQSAKKSESILKCRIKNIKREGGEKIKFVEVKVEKYESYLEDIKTEIGRVPGDTKIDTSITETVNSDDNSVIDNNDLRSNSDSETILLNSNDGKGKKDDNHNSCRLCYTVFNSEIELNEHIAAEHEGDSSLPKYIRTGRDVNQIDKKHKKTILKDQMCNICNKMFTKWYLPRHMLARHEVPMKTAKYKTTNVKKQCPECKEMFLSVGLHMRKVHKKGIEKPKITKECPFCKKYISRGFYQSHIQRHKEETNYICEHCGQGFPYLSTYSKHILIHSNELPHKCEYCPYRGRTKDLLKIHVRTHTGDYAFKCTQCEKRLLTKSNLNAHMRRHRGPVDFKCDTCNRAFYSKLDMERHISVVHMNIKPHVCNICGSAFGYRRTLTKHQAKVHKRAKIEGNARAVYLKLEGPLQPE